MGLILLSMVAGWFGTGWMVKLLVAPGLIAFIFTMADYIASRKQREKVAEGASRESAPQPRNPGATLLNYFIASAVVCTLVAGIQFLLENPF